MSTQITPVYQRFTGSAVGNAVVLLSVAPMLSTTGVDNAVKCNLLLAVRAIRTAGASGTNITPRIMDSATGSAGDVSQKWAAAGATAPGTLVNTYNINDPIYCTTAGKLWFTLAGDAADTFFYEIIFQAGS